MQYRQHGFTIVELLIVIVVIGILAAITIVAFNGVQERANTSTVRSDLGSIAKKVELFRVDSASSSYPTTGQLNSVGITASKGSYLATADRNNFYYCVHVDGNSYALGVVTKNNRGLILDTGSVVEQTNVWQAQTQAALDSNTSNSNCTSGWISGGTSAWATWVQ